MDFALPCRIFLKQTLKISWVFYQNENLILPASAIQASHRKTNKKGRIEIHTLLIKIIERHNIPPAVILVQNVSSRFPLLSSRYVPEKDTFIILALIKVLRETCHRKQNKRVVGATGSSKTNYPRPRKKSPIL